MYQITLNTFRSFIRDVTPEKFLTRKLVLVSVPDSDQMEMTLERLSIERDIISSDNKTHAVNIMMSGVPDDEVIRELNELIDYDIDFKTYDHIKAFEIIADESEGSPAKQAIDHMFGDSITALDKLTEVIKTGDLTKKDEE